MFRGRVTSMEDAGGQVWELGMKDLQALMFLHPRIKEDLQDGFRRHLDYRLQQHGPGVALDTWCTPIRTLPIVKENLPLTLGAEKKRKNFRLSN